MAERAAGATERTPSIWLDTDLALGTPSGDVDDGFALAAIALAARRGLVSLAGVSAVSGNTDGASALQAIRALLRLLQLPESLAVAEPDAPAAIAALPAGTSIVAIGPPSNLAKAAAIDAGFAARVEVRAVGRIARRWRHPLLALFDLNFRTDPRATQAFFALGFRRRLLFPLDVVRQLRLDAAALDRIGRAGALGRYLDVHSRRWLARARLLHLSRSFPVWDLPAALDAAGLLPGVVLDETRGMAVAFDAYAALRTWFELLEGPS